MITSVKVERFKEYSELVRVVSRSEKSPATNKDLIQPTHYMMLVGTHIPDQYQLKLGALVANLFRNSGVVDTEIWQTDAGLWIADALVETGAGRRLRKGEGETPLEAMINLIYDIQRY
jgi:hypothetical protein